MTKSVQTLENEYYFSKSGWQNGTKEYLEFLSGFVPSNNAVILEVGPGPQSPTTAFLKPKAAYIDGLDIDERALENPDLENAMIYGGREFPIQDESYDLVFADYVMEHVEDPILMLKEINRILLPGGHFVFRTPNINHYVSIVSRFTPHSFHLAIANKMRQKPDDAIEPYPTFYRFNSRYAVLAVMKHASMNNVELRMVEKQPSYLQFNPWVYRLGVAYERIVNSTGLLAGLRSNIFGALMKPK